MEKPSTDNRIVMTLDAGGTNLVFSAVCDNRLIIDPITLPSSGNDLDRCLQSMVHGFEAVKQLLPQPPVAISFAFPGPADYPNGIIGGNLPNFPAFRSGVALGPFLQDKFGIPVFINNDGDLFAYGEAFAGRLPEINAKLEVLGSPKRYHNLIGYTFGTGFGVGIVSGGRLHIGDNSCVETFCLYNCIDTGNIAEATVSAGGIRREYARLTGNNAEIDTKEIYDIADGTNVIDAWKERKDSYEFQPVYSEILGGCPERTESGCAEFPSAAGAGSPAACPASPERHSYFRHGGNSSLHPLVDRATAVLPHGGSGTASGKETD